MRMDVREVSPDTNLVILDGRLDAVGTDAISLSFTAAVGAAGRHALVDLSRVTFVASLGIRLLLSTARVVERKGCRMVLFGVQPAVLEVFDTVALTTIIPVAADQAAARALLTA